VANNTALPLEVALDNVIAN